MIPSFFNSDEENGDQIRRMDLNLYLGLPRRRPEPDLGSDLALNSLPEMSNSNTQSYQSISQPNTQQEEISTQHESPPHHHHHHHRHDHDHDHEHNPYSPSYAPFSPTSVEEQTLDLGVGGDDDDDDLVEHHPPYLPTYFQPSPIAQDSTEAMVIEDTNNAHAEYVPFSVSYLPTPLNLADELQVQEVDDHVPYIPILPPNPVNINNEHPSIGSLTEGTAFRPYEEVQNGTLPERTAFRPYEEIRNDEELGIRGLRRLIDRHERRRVRRYRSTGPYRVESDSSEFSSATVNALRGRRGNERLVGTDEVSEKASVEGVGAEELEAEGKKEQNNGAANFDCNVCLDVAKEPVVTSCGHLFCWPCLYQWLHLHCDHKECPVCKGEVTEENITPIYGRGSTGKEVEKEGEEGDLGLKIPPRPRGLRLESLRQRIQRPFLRRSRAEDFGSWRLVLDEDQTEASRRITRFMSAQRPQRDSDRGGSESSSSATEMSGGAYSLLDRLQQLESRGTPPALARRGADFWRRFAFYSLPSSDRLAAIAADLSNVVGRMANGGSNSGASASTSVNPQGSGPSTVPQPREVTLATDQASASSTIAVIQGDSSVPVDAHAEPSSVGSSPTLRRRRRNTVSGSLDVDGVHHACKRRRLN